MSSLDPNSFAAKTETLIVPISPLISTKVALQKLFEQLSWFIEIDLSTVRLTR